MKDVPIKIFVFITLFFAYIITSRTPLMWEDVVYTLKADASLGAAMSNSAVSDTINLGRYERVQNVEDLIESSYYHYMNANGRLFPHMTSQAFGALIGKQFFDVLNAIMFVLLITIITYFVVGNRKSFWKWWIVVLSGLWFLMPETNTCFFLMTYALNYLWSSVFCILFLLLYVRYGDRNTSLPLMIAGALFAFGSGWSHEGIAVGISAALVLDNVVDILKKQVQKQKIIWALCFCLGSFFLCMAPGNFTRTDAALPLYNHLLSFTRLKIFWLLVLSWIVFSRDFNFIKDNYLLVTALIFQSVFLFYVGYRNGRALWGVELFSFLLSMKLVVGLQIKIKSFVMLPYLILLFLLVHFSYLTWRSSEIRRQYDEVIAQYLQSSDGVVYYNLHSEHDMVGKYIPTPMCSVKGFEFYTFSVYYTRNNKQLEIKSKK